MPKAFPLDWSADHAVAIERMQSAILHGGQLATAMPRGNGKTTLGEGAVLWAVGYGHRRYIAIVGAVQGTAEEILASIRRELEDNPAIMEDFPGMAIPISCLDGKPARAKAQIIDGRLSRVKMNSSRLEFSALRCDSSGSALVALGLTGNLRGARRKMPDGSIQRPDFVFLDDPQTDESAKSPNQNDARESLITGSILGLAGPKTRIAAFLACTVIEPDDLSERILARPEWRGVRTSLVLEWPSCGRPDDKASEEMPEKALLWRRYAQIRRESLVDGDDGAAATEFYRENQEAMDEGAICSWPQRHYPEQLSALQYAMDLYIDRGPEVFYSEYQNNPAEGRKRQVRVLTADQVASKVSGLPVRSAPDADFVAAFSDVNHYGAYWCIIGVRGDMTGQIVDYGKYPARGRLVKKDATTAEANAAIYEGLAVLVGQLDKYEIKRKGNRQGIDAMAIDCGYAMETVFRLCQSLRPGFRLFPSRGVSHSKFRPRRAIGRPRNHCHLTAYDKRGQVVEHDADWWRRETQEAFASSVGAPGSLALWGDDPGLHKEFGRHIVAEYLQEFVKTQDGIEFYKWGWVPGEIHDYLDALVGAWVTACMLGADFGETTEPAKNEAAKRARRRAKVERRR
jgi:hypothetical protein